MSLLVAYQKENFAVVGTDLLRFENGVKSTLTDKLVQSHVGEHYIGWAGTMDEESERVLYSTPLEEMLNHVIDLNSTVNITKDTNYFIVNPVENQVYVTGEDSTIRRLGPGIINLLGNHREVGDDFIEIVLEAVGPLSDPMEIAEAMKEVIAYAGKLKPDKINGVATYIVQNGIIKEHYKSVESKECILL